MAINTPTDYNWGRFAPIDNTGKSRSVFDSAYKNIRFNVAATSSITLTAEHMCNLPGQSEQLYGDNGNMWRVLLEFNGIVNPVQDLYPGLVLRVPQISDVIAYLNPQSQNNAPSRVI